MCAGPGHQDSSGEVNAWSDWSVPLEFSTVAESPALWMDNFESYGLNTWPSVWFADANASSNPSGNQVVTDPTGGDNQVLRLEGVVGSFWGALTYRPAALPDAFTISTRVYNGTEVIPDSGHQVRGEIHIRHGDSWHHETNPGMGLLLFTKEGTVTGADGSVLGTYETERWYDVKIGFQRGADAITISYMLDGMNLGTVSIPVPDWIDDKPLDRVGLGAYTGSAYFDNVQVKAGVNVFQAGWRYLGYDQANSRYATEGSTVLNEGRLDSAWTVDQAGNFVLTGDVDGDGALELVSTYGSTLNIYSGSGVLEETIPLPRASFVTMLEDADGDGILDIGLGGMGSDFAGYIYKADGTLLKTFVGQHASNSNGEKWMTLLGLSNGKVLVGYNAGWGYTPRGVAAFDYETASEDWYYQIGPANGLYSVADMDNDGLLDLTMNAGTVHNGVSGNGTTDGDMYLVVVDENGNMKLSQMYPSPSNGQSWHIFADLNNDGVWEIVGFEGHDSTYYPGQSQVHVYDTEGHVLHTFDGPNNSDWSWVIGDLDGDGISEVVATANQTGMTYVLDANMNLLHNQDGLGRVKLICDVTGDGDREIVLLSGDGTLRVVDSALNEISSAQAGDRDGEVIASDLDGDGLVEIIARTDRLYVFTVADKTPPVVTVDDLTTEDTTPALSGTVDDADATVAVTVNGKTYVATNHGDGTWTLADDTISPALLNGTYDVAVTATDLAGNVGTDSTTDELTIALGTRLVTVELRNSKGELITNSGAKVQWKQGGQWFDFGDGVLDADGTEQMELSGAKVMISLVYQGQRKSVQNTLATATFSTRDVTVELRDSTGQLIENADAQVQWKQGSQWFNFGDGVLDASGTEQMELFGEKVMIALDYQGHRKAVQNTSATAKFNTRLVTVELRDSTGQLIENTGAQIQWKQGSQWFNFGDGIVDTDGSEQMELFGPKGVFYMTYQGHRKGMSTSSDTVVFSTRKVTVELRDNTGQLIENSGALVEYRQGRTMVPFGDGVINADGSEQMELFGPKIVLYMTYQGQRHGVASSHGTIIFRFDPLLRRLTKYGFPTT